MNVLPLVLCCSATQSPAEFANLALEQQDFYDAWKLIDAEQDDLTAWRIRARILYRAGDPAGAFSAALTGLAADPREIELLYYAAGAAIWLEDGQNAVNYSSRLLKASEALEDTAQNLRDWKKAARDFSEESNVLVAHEKTLGACLFRLKALSLGVMISWFIAVRRLLVYGKSSNPVS